MPEWEIAFDGVSHDDQEGFQVGRDGRGGSVSQVEDTTIGVGAANTAGRNFAE
jgi:hypothetical protein